MPPNWFLVVFLIVQGFKLNSAGECKPGYGGHSCDIACPDNCINCSDHSTCSACKAGYYNGRAFDNTKSPEVLDCSLLCRNNCVSCSKFDTCTECKRGYYGKICDQVCPEQCAVCTSNDVCTECAAGFFEMFRGKCFPCTIKNCTVCWRHRFCLKCKTGLYGSRCVQECAIGCLQNECESQSGICTCKDNFTGNLCENCVSGRYGKYCNLTCPNCVCDKNSGQCVKCNTGFFLRNKTCVSCEKGTWGQDCKNNCSEKCVECKPENGKCSVCSDGKFGGDCSKLCSANCKTLNTAPVCEIENGACIHGCSTLEKHGGFCNRSCGCNCKDGFCDWNSGKCLNGCTMNYFGDYCEKMCSFSCAPTSGRRCFSRNGTCVEGCIPGYYGPDCMHKCNRNCLNNVCDRGSGHCSFGCMQGYVGDLCTHKLAAVSNADNQKADAGSLTGAGVSVAVGMLVVAGGIFLTVFYLRKRTKKTSKIAQPADDCTGGSSNDESPPEYTEASNSASRTERNISMEQTQATIYQNNTENAVDVQPNMYEQLQDRCRNDQQYEMVSATIYQNASR